jgi:3-oxoacyl-[acyl-carrier-protein] synthase II
VSANAGRTRSRPSARPLERCVELAGLRCDFMYCVDRPDLQEALGEDAGRLMDRFTQITLLAAREAAADTRSP